MWIALFPTSFVEETVFSPLYNFGTFVRNQMAVATWAYFCKYEEDDVLPITTVETKGI
jgi:hypothetical protein